MVCKRAGTLPLYRGSFAEQAQGIMADPDRPCTRRHRLVRCSSCLQLPPVVHNPCPLAQPAREPFVIHQEAPHNLPGITGTARAPHALGLDRQQGRAGRRHTSGSRGHGDVCWLERAGPSDSVRGCPRLQEGWLSRGHASLLGERSGRVRPATSFEKLSCSPLAVLAPRRAAAGRGRPQCGGCTRRLCTTPALPRLRRLCDQLPLQRPSWPRRRRIVALFHAHTRR